jgi:hypothetical protein
MRKKCEKNKIYQQRIWPYPNHIEMGTADITVQRRLLKKDILGPGKNDLDFSILNEFNEFVFYDLDPKASEAFSYKVHVGKDNLTAEHDDESYELKIDRHEIEIIANSYLGAIHALNTLAQLIRYREGEYIIKNTPLYIKDDPKTKIRGVKIDLTQNLFSVNFLKKQMRALTLFKINRLHLVFANSEEFLIATGEETHLISNSLNSSPYNKSEIRDLVEYAANHGISIISEITIGKKLLSKISNLEKMLLELTESFYRTNFYLQLLPDLRQNEKLNIYKLISKVTGSEKVIIDLGAFNQNIQSFDPKKFIVTIKQLKKNDISKIEALEKLGFEFIRLAESEDYKNAYVANQSWIEIQNDKKLKLKVEDFENLGGVIGSVVKKDQTLLDETNFDSFLWLEILAHSENLWKFDESYLVDNIVNAQMRLAFAREDLLRLKINASPVYNDSVFQHIKDHELMLDINENTNKIPSHRNPAEIKIAPNPFCLEPNVQTKNCDGSGAPFII